MGEIKKIEKEDDLANLVKKLELTSDLVIKPLTIL